MGDGNKLVLSTGVEVTEDLGTGKVSIFDPMDPVDLPEIFIVAVDRAPLAALLMPSIPMLLRCPECGNRHIDEGEFAVKAHHTHACQHCGHVWRPAIVATTGVQFLPGFKNDVAKPGGT